MRRVLHCLITALLTLGLVCGSCFAAPITHACCEAGIKQAEMPCCTVSPAVSATAKSVLPDLTLLPLLRLNIGPLLVFEASDITALPGKIHQPNQRERYLDLRRLLN